MFRTSGGSAQVANDSNKPSYNTQNVQRNYREALRVMQSVSHSEWGISNVEMTRLIVPQRDIAFASVPR